MFLHKNKNFLGSRGPWQGLKRAENIIGKEESIPYGRYGENLRTKMTVRFSPHFCLIRLHKNPLKNSF